MSELFAINQRTEVVRKQILVVKGAFFMDTEDKARLRADIEAQMKTGLVILSGSLDAFTVDEDRVAIMEGEQNK